MFYEFVCADPLSLKIKRLRKFYGLLAIVASLGYHSRDLHEDCQNMIFSNPVLSGQVDPSITLELPFVSQRPIHIFKGSLERLLSRSHVEALLIAMDTMLELVGLLEAIRREFISLKRWLYFCLIRF